MQPAINKASRELRGRSWQELSIGDSLHRTKACEDLKKVAESVNTQVGVGRVGVGVCI